MATGTFTFFSQALSKQTAFSIVLPNDLPQAMRAENPHFERPAKTLYLLHGYSGTHTDWLYGSKVQDWAARCNLAIVMPDGGNSFYLDGPATGQGCARYIGSELVSYVSETFGLSSDREDLLIGGYSMGGFGSIHTSLLFPDTFSKAACLSGALVIHSIQGMREDTPPNEAILANYDYYRQIFGDLDKVAESEANPEVLIDGLIREGKRIPGLYLAIGTEDFLYRQNQAFRSFLTDRNISFTYEEGPGSHNFDFWTPYMERAIEWMLK